MIPKLLLVIKTVGRPIIVDFSPVTDFREATCRQYEENSCNRGGYCNFMHLKRIGRLLLFTLFGELVNHLFSVLQIELLLTYPFYADNF